MNNKKEGTEQLWLSWTVANASFWQARGLRELKEFVSLFCPLWAWNFIQYKGNAEFYFNTNSGTS